MTLLWFFVWLVADLVGDHAALTFDPVNFWAGALLFSLAVDEPCRRRPRAGLSPQRRSDPVRGRSACAPPAGRIRNLPQPVQRPR